MMTTTTTPEGEREQDSQPSDQPQGNSAATAGESDAAEAAKPAAEATPAEQPTAATSEPATEAPAPAEAPAALPSEGPLKPLWITYTVVIVIFLGIWIANWFGLMLPARQAAPDSPEGPRPVESRDNDSQQPSEIERTDSQLVPSEPDAEQPDEDARDDEQGDD